MTYTERVAIDCIDTFENFLEDRDVRIPSSDALMRDDNCSPGNSARIYGEDFGELQELLSNDISIATKRISECVFDLTLICADFIRKADIDSRALFWEIHNWALEFEEQYNDDDDYMTEIEVFGNMKLAELKEVRNIMKSLTFDTYPDMFTDYENRIENENYDNEMRVFEVPEDWALKWIAENAPWDVPKFWKENTWDETYAMYEDAIREGVLIKENIVAR